MDWDFAALAEKLEPALQELYKQAYIQGYKDALEKVRQLLREEGLR